MAVTALLLLVTDLPYHWQQRAIIGRGFILALLLALPLLAVFLGRLRWLLVVGAVIARPRTRRMRPTRRAHKPGEGIHVGKGGTSRTKPPVTSC